MPGPGKKTATKKKNTVTPVPSTEKALVPDSYVGDIDSAEGWNRVVDVLCEHFKIPDLSSRGGLKRVHSNFDSIWRRLDEAYTKYARNARIQGGIVGIYAKMCPDAILRDKLFERGFLSKLVPLLQVAPCRYLALRSLSSVAHHGSEQVFLELAKLTPLLVGFLEEYPDDKTISELVITILSHSLVPIQLKIDIGSKLENNSQPQATLLRSLDMTRVIKQVTLQMKKPTAPHFLLTHGAAILSTSALHCPNAVLANPSAVHFLVAGLRSSEWENRSASLNGVIRLFRIGADEELRSIDPNIFFRMNTRQFPDHLTDILADYGVFRGEIFITVATAREFQAALMKVVQDRDLYSLGLKLSELITRTEFSIADGAFVAEDPVTGKHDSSFDTGLPFKNYRDALPLCAKLLREKARAGDLDKADILDIKFNIMSANLRLASSIADKGLLRNPEVAYFHYAKTLLADPTIGLRSAKKGLKCKDSTPFIRFQLLQRAVAHAGEMGLQILENTSARIEGEGGRWEEGVAFVMSAWKDSKVFIEEAPPDNRYMSQVLYWNILLGIVIRGPESSDDLNEIQASLQKLSQADDFKTKVFRLPILRTQLRQAQEVVVKKSTGAIAEWDNAILRLNNSSPRTHGSHGHPPHVSSDSDSAAAQNDSNEETLNRFLEDLQLDDGGCAAKMTSAHPKVNANRVVLYQCSWCENPSAVLRKCKCAKTRYCDASCQRLHWGKHKKECKA